jgi:tetratricopeptide (TPR) repeat protein
VQRLTSEAGEWFSSSPKLSSKLESFAQFTEWFNTAAESPHTTKQNRKNAGTNGAVLTQADFDIPSDMQSPSNWEAVIQMLDDIESAQQPGERGQRLCAAGKRIYSLYEEERGREWTSAHPMCADDVMPIASYCAFSSAMQADVVLDLTENCTESGMNGYVLVTMLMAVSSAEIISLERSSVEQLQSHLEQQGVAFHGLIDKHELIGLILRGRGSAALTLGKTTDALTWLTQSLHYSSLAKERSICLSERSRTFRKLGRVPAALEDARRAVELSPPLVDATCSLQEALVAADEERLRMEAMEAVQSNKSAAKAVSTGVDDADEVEHDKIDIEKDMWVSAVY